MKNISKNPMFRYLILLTICSTGGLQIWRTLFNNFSVEIVNLNGYQIGVIQSVREIPGFLALLVIYFLLIIKEHTLSALSILILGLGVALTGLLPFYQGVILTTLIMSFGFHYYETTNQSLTLQYFGKDTSPWVFGKQRSLAAATNVIVGVLIFFLTPFLSYKQLYLVFGLLLIAVSLWALTKNPVDKDLIPQHKKMILKKKYGLYYFLTFMAGARRQIFIAFAIFLMVKRFNFSVQEITALFVINNIVNYFLSPLIGKSIIKFGERWVLSLEYFSLIFVFIGYAVIEAKIIIAVIYVLDHIFFNFAIAIRTYFQKIGDPKDIAPTMAVGFTINHVAAVFLPVIGGYLWMIDYRIPFIIGACLSAISLGAVQKIKTVA
ncbi:MAG: MFS transporter [Desulfobacteraceae bacterium]|nr:MFS transporter [Desulfobacteraceae bacterium]